MLLITDSHYINYRFVCEKSSIIYFGEIINIYIIKTSGLKYNMNHSIAKHCSDVI